MTSQQANELMLLQLWNLGETLFDGALNQITKMVERAESDECSKCWGHGEYISGASDSDYGEVLICGCKGRQ